jgi:hypothetical protein
MFITCDVEKAMNVPFHSVIAKYLSKNYVVNRIRHSHDRLPCMEIIWYERSFEEYMKRSARRAEYDDPPA